MRKFLWLIATTVSINSMAQNVGIGTTSPAGKLQINHRSSNGPGLLLVDSNNNAGGFLRWRNINHTTGMNITLYSPGPFNANQFMDIGSDTLTALTVKGDGNLGIRNLNPSYPLDIGGDINARSLIRLNGNAGVLGQVLTSNGGSSDPSWQTPTEVYPETYRASIALSSTSVPSATETNVNIGIAYYNLNPTAIDANASSIIINTAGLYEIEGKVTFNTGIVTVASGGSPYASFTIRTDNGAVRNYNQITQRIDQFSVTPGALSFQQTYPFRIVLHCIAATTISFRANIYQYASGTPVVSGGYVTINRID